MKKYDYISLAQAAEDCPYSQAYLSLRARQGKLKAVKLGRNWATTKEWIDDYVQKAEQYFERNIQKQPEKKRFQAEVQKQEQEREREQFLKNPSLNSSQRQRELSGILNNSQRKLSGKPKLNFGMVTILAFLVLIFSTYFLGTGNGFFYDIKIIAEQGAGLARESIENIELVLENYWLESGQAGLVRIDHQHGVFKETFKIFGEYFQWLGQGITRTVLPK
jgi:hypothetical protein